MGMIYILKVTTETDAVGANWEDEEEVEIPDSATEKEKEDILEDHARDIFFNRCSYGWSAQPKTDDNK